MRRNLDGMFFRMGTENICFSDLTDDQMYEVLKDRSEDWLKNLAVNLAHCIKDIGDEFDIICEIN